MSGMEWGAVWLSPSCMFTNILPGFSLAPAGGDIAELGVHMWPTTVWGCRDGGAPQSPAPPPAPSLPILTIPCFTDEDVSDLAG